MREHQLGPVNEIIQNSFENVYQTAILRERKLIGRWLEEQVNNSEPEVLVELLYNTIRCLKRGVFPDPL